MQLPCGFRIADRGNCDAFPLIPVPELVKSKLWRRPPRGFPMASVKSSEKPKAHACHLRLWPWRVCCSTHLLKSERGGQGSDGDVVHQNAMGPRLRALSYLRRIGKRQGPRRRIDLVEWQQNCRARRCPNPAQALRGDKSCGNVAACQAAEDSVLVSTSGPSQLPYSFARKCRLQEELPTTQRDAVVRNATVSASEIRVDGDAVDRPGLYQLAADDAG